jgi:hypothetical protein
LTYPLDRTPPVTAITLNDLKHQVGSKTYVSGSTTFTLSAKDTSGVKETKYRIDNGSWNAYSSGFTLSTFPDGEHTISYYSVDNVNNTEAEKTLTVVLDKTPPTISNASPTGTIGSTSVTFSVKAEDFGSGVKEIRLTINGISLGAMTTNGNTYTKTVSLSEGSYTWSIEAVDNVGNTITQSYSLIVVTGPPMEILLIVIGFIMVATTASIVLVTYKKRRKITEDVDGMIRKVKEFMKELEEG